MRPLSVKRAAFVILAALTLLVLALNLNGLGSGLGWQQYGFFAGVYLALTAFALAFGVLFTRGELGSAHAVGMLAFLSFPADALPFMLWAVFLGGVLGSALQYWRGAVVPHLRRRQWDITQAGMVTARVTLSFYAAAEFYILIGGQLPLVGGSNAVVPLLVLYVAVYAASYLLIYMLEVYSAGHNILTVARENSLELTSLIIVPPGLAILGAIVYNQLPLELFLFVILILVLSVVVQFSYSRTQNQLQRQLNELHTLDNIARALQSDNDIPKMLAAVCPQITQVLQTDTVIVAVRHDHAPTFDLPLNYQQGAPAKDIDPADRVLIGQIIAEQASRLYEAHVAEALQGQRIAPHRFAVTSWMAAPMRVGGTVVGAIATYTTNDRHFLAPDLRLLQLLASSMAAAVNNAQLYHRQQERVSLLNTLNTISTLLSSTLSSENVLDTITTSASMISGADAVSVYLRTTEDRPNEDAFTGEKMRMVRSAGLSDRFELNPPPPITKMDVALSLPNEANLPEYAPLIVSDVHTDTQVRHLRDRFTDEQIETIMELPLMDGQHHIGIVALYYRSAQVFDNERTEFLRTFANEAVQAIRNAQLYTSTDEALERRVIQLSILAAIGHQTSASVDMKTIGELVLRYATDYTMTDHGLIALYDTRTRELRIMAQVGYPSGTFAHPALLSQGVVARALLAKDARTIDDTLSEPNVVKFFPSTRSQLAVPILRDQDPLGVLLLEATQVDAFHAEDVDFVVQLVNQASIAIDNRNLFQTVAQSRDRMQLILDAMTDAIMLLNRHGDIVLANPAVKLLNLRPDDILNRNIHDLIAGDGPLVEIWLRMGFESPAALESLLQNLSTERQRTPEPTTYTAQGKHGSLYIERHTMPIHGDTGSGVMFVFYDRTEKHELDRTRDDFTRMIVHDLRSPLTAVTTSMRIVREVVPQDSENYSTIEQITEASQQAVRKLLRRVDALLDVAKLESGEIDLDTEVVALPDLMQNVLEELEPLAKEREILLKLALPEELPLVHVDADKVERVLQNLIDNALKYTPKHTEVTLRAGGAIKQGAVSNFLRVDVVDMGPGIPTEYKQRLFDRFVQIRGRRGARRGVGLGLTFCRLVVEAHGGQIWVEDNPQGGSIFAFTLPTISADTEAEQSAPNGAGAQ